MASQLPMTISAVSSYLKAREKNLAAVLPKHMSAARMRGIAMAAIARDPKLMKSDPASLYMGILQAAQLGLEVGLDAHLLPFWDKHKERFNVAMVPDYQGLINIAYRHPKISTIDAHAVREGDHFDFSYGLNPRLEHVPAVQRGDLTHAYAVARFVDGGSVFVVADRDEVEKHRLSSRNKDGATWTQWPEAMWKKTAIRILYKILPKTHEMAMALQVENLAEEGKESTAVGIEGEEVFLEADAQVVQAGEEGSSPTADEPTKKTRSQKMAEQLQEKPPFPAEG